MKRCLLSLSPRSSNTDALGQQLGLGLEMKCLQEKCPVVYDIAVSITMNCMTENHHHQLDMLYYRVKLNWIQSDISKLLLYILGYAEVVHILKYWTSLFTKYFLLLHTCTPLHFSKLHIPPPLLVKNAKNMIGFYLVVLGSRDIVDQSILNMYWLKYEYQCHMTFLLLNPTHWMFFKKKFWRLLPPLIICHQRDRVVLINGTVLRQTASVNSLVLEFEQSMNSRAVCSHSPIIPFSLTFQMCSLWLMRMKADCWVTSPVCQILILWFARWDANPWQ